MRAYATTLKPGIPEIVVQQMHKLAEVRRSFDRRAAETKVFCHLIIVDRQVSIIFLVAKHLPRMPKLAVLTFTRCHALSPLYLYAFIPLRLYTSTPLCL